MKIVNLVWWADHFYLSKFIKIFLNILQFKFQMTTSFAQKRKRDSEGEQSEEENKLSGLQLYLLKKQKWTQKNQSTKDKPILIENLRKLPKLEKGLVNLPKDILVEALLYVKDIKLSLTSEIREHIINALKINVFTD